MFLSAVDKLSRLGTFLPIKSRCIADIRKALLKHFALYALKVSDNEPALKSIEVRGLLYDLNVQQYFTPSNYSQVNEIIKRFHSTISEIFQTNTVLRGLVGVVCLVYMGDIIVYSTGLDERYSNLALVLSAFEDANLKVQLDKSDFLQKEVAFLGHIVNEDGVNSRVL